MVTTNRENTPNARLFINALRNLGYNNISAINDIIDNSIDAGATRIDIDIDLKDPLLDHIRFIDNGGGMPMDTLDQALRLGSDTPHDSTSDLGFFGMGLSTASISIATILVVLTKQAGAKDVLVSVQDLDAIASSNAFVKDLGVADEADTAFFNEMLPEGHGTIVTLVNCDKIKNRNGIVNRAKKEISRVFREYLSTNVTITVNKEDLKPTDIFMLADEGEIYSDEEYEVTGIRNGKPYTDTIRVVLGVLPDYGNKGSAAKGINANNQGFYVIRNNREIMKGATLDMYTRHPVMNRFRGEIYFSAELDEAMGVNFQKNGVDLSQAIHDKLFQQIEPQLRTIRKKCTRANIKNKGTDVDHKESERQIAKKASLLNAPRGPITLDLNGAINENENNPVRFDTFSGGKNGDIYETELHGKTVVINWNTDHSFYEKLVLASSDSHKDLAIGIDFLIYSMAMAELRMSNEKNLDVLNQFKTDISLTLNTLFR